MPMDNGDNSDRIVNQFLDACPIDVVLLIVYSHYLETSRDAEIKPTVPEFQSGPCAPCTMHHHAALLAAAAAELGFSGSIPPLL